MYPHILEQTRHNLKKGRKKITNNNKALANHVFMLHATLVIRTHDPPAFPGIQFEVKGVEILHSSRQPQSLFKSDKSALIWGQQKENKLRPTYDEWKRRVEINYSFNSVLRLITFSFGENTHVCMHRAHTVLIHMHTLYTWTALIAYTTYSHTYTTAKTNIPPKKISAFTCHESCILHFKAGFYKITFKKGVLHDWFKKKV